jgi:hypothetical protein
MVDVDIKNDINDFKTENFLDIRVVESTNKFLTIIKTLLSADKITLTEYIYDKF